MPGDVTEEQGEECYGMLLGAPLNQGLELVPSFLCPSYATGNRSSHPSFTTLLTMNPYIAGPLLETDRGVLYPLSVVCSDVEETDNMGIT